MSSQRVHTIIQAEMAATKIYRRRYGEVPDPDMSFIERHLFGGKERLAHYRSFLNGFLYGTEWGRL